MEFNTNNVCIHRTSAFHIWFTFNLLWLFAFIPCWVFSFYSALSSPPFSSFEAYTYFYLIKDFVRFLSSLSFSHLFSCLLCNTLLYYNVDTQLKDRRSSLSMQWRHNMLCWLSCCVGCYIIIIICEGKEKWFLSNVRISNVLVTQQ